MPLTRRSVLAAVLPLLVILLASSAAAVVRSDGLDTLFGAIVGGLVVVEVFVVVGLALRHRALRSTGLQDASALDALEPLEAARQADRAATDTHRQ